MEIERKKETLKFTKKEEERFFDIVRTEARKIIELEFRGHLKTLQEYHRQLDRHVTAAKKVRK